MLRKPKTSGTIKSLKLTNYKCHRETQEIEFAPITLLVGPNSSGKTAFVEPLLLLKQTFELGASTVNPIVLNGSLIQLGAFTDVIYNRDPSNKMKIRLKIRIPLRRIRKEINVFCSIQIEYSKEQKRMILSEVLISSEFFNLTLDTTKIIFEGKIIGKKIGKLKRSVPKERNLRDLMNIIPFMVRGRVTEREEGRITFREYFILREIIENIISSIESIQFIGPIREYPSRYYLASGEKVSNVGSSGEYAIHILKQNEVLGGDLKEQLSKWLYKLDVAEDLYIKPIDPNLFSLEIKSSVTKTTVNIADTGFGVSQIIPVIVQSYLTPHNSTLILEQPEIHLHPRAQAILADLFIELAKLGRNFIVETHSEHLILRLQRRVAEKEIENDKVKIYYFNPTGTGVVIREIKIDSKGQLLDFPKGFMEEGLEEAYKMALASESE